MFRLVLSSRAVFSCFNRVQPGYCFHLFTQPRAQSLDDYQLPEMLRTPLEELCLQIKVHARTFAVLKFEGL